MKKRKPVFKLDAEEREIARAYNRGELKTVSNLKEEIAKAKRAAINYMRKQARINIRISNNDLEKIKQKAAYEGLPYQTLIASILHKYAEGTLETKK